MFYKPVCFYINMSDKELKRAREAILENFKEHIKDENNPAPLITIAISCYKIGEKSSHKIKEKYMKKTIAYLQHARKNTFTEGRKRINEYIAAIYYYRLGNIKQAISNAEQSLPSQDRATTRRIYSFLSILYEEIGEYESARDYARALEIPCHIPEKHSTITDEEISDAKDSLDDLIERLFET